jgi:hypothetical protein
MSARATGPRRLDQPVAGVRRTVSSELGIVKLVLGGGTRPFSLHSSSRKRDGICSQWAPRYGEMTGIEFLVLVAICCRIFWSNCAGRHSGVAAWP